MIITVNRIQFIEILKLLNWIIRMGNVYWVRNIGTISFAQRLRDLMREKGISQQLLADKVGVSKNTVTAWLKGTPLKRNREIVLDSLAREFDVDVGYLTCEQVDRRKVLDSYELNNLETKELRHRLTVQNCVQELIAASGYSIEFGTLLVPVEHVKFMQDGCLYEAGVYDDGINDGKLLCGLTDSVITISKKGKESIGLLPYQFENLCRNIEDYLSFQISQLGNK